MKLFSTFFSEARAARRRKGGPSYEEAQKIAFKKHDEKEARKDERTYKRKVKLSKFPDKIDANTWKYEKEKKAREKRKIRITSKGIEGVSYMSGKDRGQDNRSPQQKATSVEGERMRRLNDRTQG